jgi:hypothetical protein
MSAMGFFSVGRENMVGLFSTMLTYLIIIIQFDQVCVDTQHHAQIPTSSSSSNLISAQIFKRVVFSLKTS